MHKPIIAFAAALALSACSFGTQPAETPRNVVEKARLASLARTCGATSWELDYLGHPAPEVGPFLEAARERHNLTKADLAQLRTDWRQGMVTSYAKTVVQGRPVPPVQDPDELRVLCAYVE